MSGEEAAEALTWTLEVVVIPTVVVVGEDTTMVRCLCRVGVMCVATAAVVVVIDVGVVEIDVDGGVS
jgi:hypothetical protein